ncbi:MAG: DUF1788 domain-containing protein [Trueperaceae bacterium]|nr:DUF1788 domain-containing protein [Trueperaceae bacterium]
MLSLGQRLERLESKLSQAAFLNNEGIGNEIGFHIFAYEPKDEPLVSGYLPNLKERLGRAGVVIQEFNLYHICLSLLEERNLLEQSFQLETQKGSTALSKALGRIIRPEKLVEQIRQDLNAATQLVFITGVGAIYPLIRSHTVLNNLHDVVDTIPLVMFFPGTYDGQELRLFNALKDDNYYRAFPLLSSED